MSLGSNSASYIPSFINWLSNAVVDDMKLIFIRSKHRDLSIAAAKMNQHPERGESTCMLASYQQR